MDNGMSDTDTLNQADRLKSVGGKSFPNCITVTGCWSFYAPQQSGLNVWTNTGAASYNSATLTLRHALSKGFAFDFNYTLGHSIDRGAIKSCEGTRRPIDKVGRRDRRPLHRRFERPLYTFRSVDRASHGVSYFLDDQVGEQSEPPCDPDKSDLSPAAVSRHRGGDRSH